MANKETFIVIGSSASSIGALGKLRSLNPTATIICITAETENPYNRCLLADHLSGAKPKEAIYTKKEDFFTEQNIQLFLGTQVTGIAPESNTITTLNGQTFTYTKLFLGIGKSAYMPPIPGLKTALTVPFYGLDDVKKIHQTLTTRKIKRVLIVGAGLTGLECADALKGYHLAITMVEQASHVLPQQINTEGAAFIEKLLTNAGIKLYKNTTIDGVQPFTDQTATVNLATGEKLETDLIIVATGGRPNIALAQQAGLVTQGQGLLVNEYMQTSEPTIFAGGDICLVKDLITGEKVQSCLWPDAVMQGIVAAHNMSGITKTYAGTLLVTSSNIFGTTFVTCGKMIPAKNHTVLVKKDITFYHRLLIDNNGVLQGFVMVGNITNIGQLRKAILDKTPVIPQERISQISY